MEILNLKTSCKMQVHTMVFHLIPVERRLFSATMLSSLLMLLHLLSTTMKLDVPEKGSSSGSSSDAVFQGQFFEIYGDNGEVSGYKVNGNFIHYSDGISMEKYFQLQ